MHDWIEMLASCLEEKDLSVGRLPELDFLIK